MTETSVLIDILKELRAIRRLLENQDSGDVGQAAQSTTLVDSPCKKRTVYLVKPKTEVKQNGNCEV